MLFADRIFAQIWFPEACLRSLRSFFDSSTCFVESNSIIRHYNMYVSTIEIMLLYKLNRRRSITPLMHRQSRSKALDYGMRWVWVVYDSSSSDHNVIRKDTCYMSYFGLFHVNSGEVLHRHFMEQVEQLCGKLHRYWHETGRSNSYSMCLFWWCLNYETFLEKRR